MKICLICTEKLPVPPVRGGAIQTYIAGVLPYLKERHELTVISRTDPTLPEAEEAGRVRYLRVPAEERPEAYFHGVARLLSTCAFDIVLLFNRPAFLEMIAGAVGPTPILLSLHNEMMGPERLEPAAARTALERSAGVVCISEYIRNVVAADYPEFAWKLRIVRSGVDLAAFPPIWTADERRCQVRRQLGLEGRPVILHASRLSPKKGNYLVVTAMREVLQSHPETILLMVGSRWYGNNDPNAYTRYLERLARPLGSGVRFLGWVPYGHMPDLFLAGDLFVHASQWQEPLARVHYEAMASGLPIITTDRGGNGEVVVDGVSGLIARPHDEPVAFARQMRRLIADPGLREALGRRGRALAEERYSFARVARELEEVFTSCASW